ENTRPPGPMDRGVLCCQPWDRCHTMSAMTADSQRPRAVWSLEGSCSLPPEAYYPEEDNSSVAQTKETCNTCPVIRECRNYAILHEEWGIWGGMDEAERKVELAKQKDQLGPRAIREDWLEPHNLLSRKDRQDYEFLEAQWEPWSPGPPLSPEEYQLLSAPAADPFEGFL